MRPETDLERARTFVEASGLVLYRTEAALGLAAEFAAVRLEERRAIVAWLRVAGDRGDSASAQAPVWTALRQAADRIECGEATP